MNIVCIFSLLKVHHGHFFVSFFPLQCFCSENNSFSWALFSVVVPFYLFFLAPFPFFFLLFDWIFLAYNPIDLRDSVLDQVSTGMMNFYWFSISRAREGKDVPVVIVVTEHPSQSMSQTKERRKTLLVFFRVNFFSFFFLFLSRGSFSMLIVNQKGKEI